MRYAIAFLFAMSGLAQGVLLDRIAIVVDQSIIKDSDIERDIRLTEFLNGEPLSINQAEKKKAAKRLVEQVFLRHEIRTGGYPYATKEQVAAQFDELTKGRPGALKRYGLTEANLLDQLRWQRTVLDFVNARFKPAVTISDDAVDKYYREHASELRKEDPKAPAAELRAKARDLLSEEEVNEVFFEWLDDHRKNANIKFHEEGLA